MALKVVILEILLCFVFARSYQHSRSWRHQALKMSLVPPHTPETFDASGIKMFRSAAFDEEGSGLVTTRAFKEGDVMATIPLEMCLVSHRSGAIQGGATVGQTDMMWDAAGDLRTSISEEDTSAGRTWDINLALALLDATAGASMAGEFWDSYTGAYPRPETVTVPSCMSASMLENNELQHHELTENAKSQRNRLARLFPDCSLQDPAQHRMTAEQHTSHTHVHTLTPLQWAFSMVRSRCFQLGAQDWFAVVPIIEVANHASVASATFSAQCNLDNGGLPVGNCILKAKKDLLEGEAVTLRYDEGVASSSPYSNQRLLTQYGFVLEDNPSDGDDSAIPWVSPSTDVSHSTEATQVPLPVTPTDTAVDVAVDALVEAALQISFDQDTDPNLRDKVPLVSSALGSKIMKLQSLRVGARFGTTGTHREAEGRDCDSSVLDSSGVDRVQGMEQEKGEGKGEGERGGKEILRKLCQQLAAVEESFHTSLGHDEALCAKVMALSAAFVSQDGEVVEVGEEIEGACVYNRVQYMAALKYRIDRKRNVQLAKMMIEVAAMKS